jgi:predicted patatin/cPLA2 family phospholipase
MERYVEYYPFRAIAFLCHIHRPMVANYLGKALLIKRKTLSLHALCIDCKSKFSWQMMDNRTYTLTSRSGLVLEGGGMRGVFTSGVLDNLMDRGIKFPYAIGVSAGACNGLSYMSHQRGRAKYSNIDLLEQYHYIGLRHLLTKRNIMDFDLLFHKFPTEIIPYDYEAYAANSGVFEMVTTDCRTGEACYFHEKESPERIIDIVKTSSRLPYVTPISYVDGRPMLDGGISDSLPVRRAMSCGYDNICLVLTRNGGYRKPQTASWVPHFAYRKYPALRSAIASRNERYNSDMELIERLEDEGKILVIRPEQPIAVGRMERDISKLLDLYDQGYAAASKIEFIKHE